MLQNKRSLGNEKPADHEYRKPTRSNEDPAQPKLNNKRKKIRPKYQTSTLIQKKDFTREKKKGKKPQDLKDPKLSPESFKRKEGGRCDERERLTFKLQGP